MVRRLKAASATREFWPNTSNKRPFFFDIELVMIKNLFKTGSTVDYPHGSGPADEREDQPSRLSADPMAAGLGHAMAWWQAIGG